MAGLSCSRLVEMPESLYMSIPRCNPMPQHVVLTFRKWCYDKDRVSIEFRVLFF